MKTTHLMIGVCAAALALTGCETIDTMATETEKTVAENNAKAEAETPSEVTVAPPAPTDATPTADSDIINGRNLKQVRTANQKARFAETSSGTWTEYNHEGYAFNTFTETGRDDWSVYLLDAGRNIRLQLDVHRDMIKLGQNGGAMADQWPITDASKSVSTAYTSDDANGENLAMAAFGDNQARFVETSDGVWTEYNSEGQKFNTFTETGRDDWSVYMKDEGRNIRIQLDVHRKMIRLGQNGGAMADQWAMTSYGQRS